MISPFKGNFRVTSPRGYRTIGNISEYHGGIDMVGLDDATVLAVAEGTVYTLYEKDGFGYYVRQQLSDGRRIYYGHMKSFLITGGSSVTPGTPLGIMGATGKVTGPHLHLELRPAGYSSDSLDISGYTGIPNTEGIYKSQDENGGTAVKNLYSYDDTVEALIKCGIITLENMLNWELMLSGRAELKTEFVRTIFDRCCAKITRLENKK